MCGMLKAKQTESGPETLVVRDHNEAELTWAGLPYHIWKEARKISDPALAPVNSRA